MIENKNHNSSIFLKLIFTGQYPNLWMWEGDVKGRIIINFGRVNRFGSGEKEGNEKRI